MKKLVEAFPNHLREALNIGRAANLVKPDRKISNIVISGLGGSGIGGKIVSQLVADKLSVPIVCTNDYVLPEFVSNETLVIISSYSGDTEETVAALHEAVVKGAEIACVTSGGKIGAYAKENGLNVIFIPGGNPPRSMFGYSSVQLFFVLKAYEFIDNYFEKEIENSIQLIESEISGIRAESKKIAEQIVTRIPILYSEALYEGVAIRWRQQVNENSKMLCWHHVFPEMNHNELVGWTGGDNRVAVVILRNNDDHKRSQIRMELCKKLMGEKCNTIIEAWSKGSTRIERSMYLIHLGDWLSIDLAELRNEDAVAIPAIVFLKNELSKV
ncbi:MAG: bifunctional phosphoglucose/phosphomannose isomerase [Flavobacteriales bacterium]|nr:bifunctional phosphoglucose/phosphomannose isomerase [Flavobacteriales bacterium]